MKVLSLLTLAALLSACATGAPPVGMQAIPVPITSVKSGTVTDSSDYVASLQSRQSVTLQARVSGYVEEIFVQAGDQVEAGSPILRIDASTQTAQLSQAEAAAATAAADLESARATLRQIIARRDAVQSDLDFNQKEFQRFSQLTNAGATSRQQLDQVSNQLRNARAELGQIKAQILAQEANIKSADRRLAETRAAINQQRAQLNFYTVNAPFRGVVGDMVAKIGDTVSTTSPLTTVTQNEVLEVQVAVPVENAPRLKLGMDMQILDNQNQLLSTGKVSFIAPDINQQTQSILVKAVFTNENNQLRVNQFVRARLIWESRPGVFVPTAAISRLGGQDFVFVATPKPDQNDQLIAKQTPVKLGKIIDNQQEVVSGLNPTAQIVTAGILQLQDGVAIVQK